MCLSQPLMARTDPRYRLIDVTPLNFEPNPDVIGTMGINNKGEVTYTYEVEGENGLERHVWDALQSMDVPQEVIDAIQSLIQP